MTAFRVGERACVGWLAGACGVCSSLHARPREPLRAGALHGLGSRRRLRDARDRARRLRAATARGVLGLDAAPLLCGGVIGYRSLKRSGIAPGGKLGLYGFGASATLTIQVARHWGCRVFVCTRSPSEQARAKQLGAEWVGGYDELPPVPLDAAITFAPAGDVVIAALRALDRGGTVAINAIHLDRVPEFSYDLLWWERNLVSVANYTRARRSRVSRSRRAHPGARDLRDAPARGRERRAREAARRPGERRGRAHDEVRRCTGRDLNPHVFRRWNLNPLRLPFRHPCGG